MTLDLAAAEWLNPPPRWRLEGDLWLATGRNTDFWQHSFYGFRRDDGHALLRPAPAEFTATVSFEGHYRQLYEQAGMMLRIDAGTWLKTGVEFSDGVANFSVVVTRQGRSDWSVVPAAAAEGRRTVRLVRKGDAVLVHAQAEGGRWQHLRLADFPAGKARIGPMACSPQSEGFEARFIRFDLAPPLPEPLH
jgi:regulation of enolase protein 1 (concanavalin A-like superfamily)